MKMRIFPRLEARNRGLAEGDGISDVGDIERLIRTAGEASRGPVRAGACETRNGLPWLATLR